MNENETKRDGIEVPAEDIAEETVDTEAADTTENPETPAEKDSAPAKKEKKKNGKKALMKAIHGKNFKYGSMSTIITVVVIVLTILINVGASALVNRYPSLKLDMSKGSKMSLSEDLTETVDGVEHKTEIIFCTTKDNYENTFNNYLAQKIGMEAMNEGTRITTLAEKAAERNANISVRYIDLDENPSFVNEYPNESLDSSKIIVRTDYRYRVLTLSDLFQQKQSMDYSTYQTVTTYYSNVEYALANALVSTNLDEVPVIAVATGHGETEPTTLTALLKSNNFQTTEVNLMTDKEIDQEVDVIVITSPTADFTAEQIELLEDFLYNNGNYGKNVLYITSPTRSPMPNLDAFLADWGMELGETGAYLRESNDKRYVQYPELMLLDVNTADDSCLSSFTNSTVGTLLSAPMQLLFTFDSGVSTKALLSTSEDAYVVPGDVENASDYKPNNSDYGSNVVLGYGEKYISKNNEMLYSRVAVCTSLYAMDYFLTTNTYGNKDITLTFFKFMTGTLGNDDLVYIAATEFNDTDMALTYNTVNTVGLWIFTILVPLAVLAIGFVIWLRRRHL